MKCIRRSAVRMVAASLACLAAAHPAQALMVDDFEQNNNEPNTLGFWSSVYVGDPASAGGLVPDIPGVQKNGARGGILYYSNGVSETARCLFYTVLQESAPYRDLSAQPLYVRFWVRANEGTPAIDAVRLESDAPAATYAELDFAAWNGGSDYLAAYWREISIPATSFLAGAQGGFSLSAVKTLSIALKSGSSTGGFSSLYLDDIQITNQPAPSTGRPVTDTVVVDDFEQNNGNANTVGFWSDVYVGGAASIGGLVPDLAGAQRSGLRGGVLYYSNGVPEAVPCEFYTVLEDAAPYLDLTATSLYVRFWIKANAGTPAIDRVILEGDGYLQYGRVSFAAYNGGTASVAGDWNEISIPVSDFAADTAGGFSLTRVGLVAFTFVSNSSLHGISSVLLDDLRLSTQPAPVPTPEATVYYWLTADDFEQDNGNANTLGHWSDVSFDPAQSFGGFIPDFSGVQHDGGRGGVLFYSNGPSATVPSLFYSVLSETWPHVDMSDTQMVFSFWIRGGDGAPAVDAIVLQGDTAALSARASFADYNEGSDRVAPEWRWIVVPVTGFMAHAVGGFSAERVRLFGLEFAPTASVGQVSSLWIDEIRVGKPDQDRDGLPDDWEGQFFDNPTNGLAAGDDDHDGASNLAEFLADTHPGDSNSVFLIEDIQVQSPPVLSFESSSRRLYRVLYSSNLLTGAWASLGSDLWGTGSLLQVEDPDESPYRRFYRVGVRLP